MHSVKTLRKAKVSKSHQGICALKGLKWYHLTKMYLNRFRLRELRVEDWWTAASVYIKYWIQDWKLCSAWCSWMPNLEFPRTQWGIFYTVLEATETHYQWLTQQLQFLISSFRRISNNLILYRLNESYERVAFQESQTAKCDCVICVTYDYRVICIEETAETLAVQTKQFSNYQKM